MIVTRGQGALKEIKPYNASVYISEQSAQLIQPATVLSILYITVNHLLALP